MKLKLINKGNNVLRPNRALFFGTGQRQANSIDFVKENFYEVY